MLLQVFQRLGFALIFQVVRAGNEVVEIIGQLASDQRRAFQFAITDGQVIAFFDQIRLFVGKVQLHLQSGVLLGEVSQDGHQKPLLKHP